MTASSVERALFLGPPRAQATPELLDNFYADAEVSAQGWNWSVGANSNPYVEQTWVGNYSGRNHPYDYEGGNYASAMNRDPLDSYIWDRLADAHVSFRNYGFYETDNVLNTGANGADPRLAASTDPNYYGWDLRCPDSSGTFTPLMTCNTRYDEWAREFSQYVKNNDLPAVQFVRFGNDHTEGTAAGFPTPRAYVADNDYALGRLVDTVSHSKYWSSTAIFVVEDDAQAGPDHVDAHHATAQRGDLAERQGSRKHDAGAPAPRHRPRRLHRRRLILKPPSPGSAEGIPRDQPVCSVVPGGDDRLVAGDDQRRGEQAESA